MLLRLARFFSSMLSQFLKKLVALHWPRVRTNNIIERLNREIRRRTCVVERFPDGNSALMLLRARLHYVASIQWGNEKCMNMKLLEDTSIAG